MMNYGFRRIESIDMGKASFLLESILVHILCSDGASSPDEIMLDELQYHLTFDYSWFACPGRPFLSHIFPDCAFLKGAGDDRALPAMPAYS